MAAASNAKVAEIYVQLQADTAKFRAALKDSESATKSFRRTMASEMTEAKHGIHLVSEEIGVKIPRALQGVLAKLPGVSSAISSAFNVIAVVAFAQIAYETGEKIVEHFKKAEEAAQKAREKAEELSDGWHESNATLSVTNDKLEKQIAMIEHKPFNGLKLSLDEAIESSQNLSKTLQKNITEESTLLQTMQSGHIMQTLGNTIDNNEARDYLHNYQADIRKIKEEYEDKISHATNQKDVDALRSQESAAIIGKSNWYSNAAKNSLASFNSDVDQNNMTRTGVHVNGNNYRESMASIIDMFGSNATTTKLTQDILNNTGRLDHDKDRKLEDEQSKAAASKRKEAEEKEITVLTNSLAEKHNLYTLDASYDLKYWENILATHQWAKDSIEKIDAKINESANKFHAALQVKIKEMNTIQKTISGLEGQEPKQGFKIEENSDVYDKAIAQERIANTKQELALSSALLKNDLARGRIANRDYARGIQSNSNAGYMAERKALESELNSIKSRINFFTDTPAEQAKIVEIQNQIGALDAANKLAELEYQMADAAYTVKGTITDVFASISQNGQDSMQKIAETAKQLIDGVNNSIVNQLITGKGNWRNTLAQSSRSLAKTGLQKAEGALFGVQSKRGESKSMPLFVEATNLPSALSGTVDGKNDSGAMLTGIGGATSSLLSKSSSGGGTAKSIMGGASSLLGGLFGALNDSDKLGGMFGGKLFGSGSLFGGFRALGGPVAGNTPYIVGERGPELLVPGMSGSVIPNNQLNNIGGNTTHTYNIDARGTDPALVESRVRTAILASHNSAVSTSLQAGRDQNARTVQR
jgi:hypothetical protein